MAGVVLDHNFCFPYNGGRLGCVPGITDNGWAFSERDKGSIMTKVAIESPLAASSGARIQIKGTDRFLRGGKSLEAKCDDTIAPFNPLDVTARLNELSRLEDGWLDGEGKALPIDGIKWLTECFDLYFLSGLQSPYLFPTEDGGICAEWSLVPLSVSLEIDLVTHHC